MTYRSLLVLLDHDTRNDERVQLAVRLSRDFDAHLTGLAPTGLIDIPAAAEVASPLVDYAVLAHERLVRQAQVLTQRFNESCRAAGREKCHAVLDEDDRIRSLVSHGHCADLVILSQPDPSASGHSRARTVLENAVLQSARPTLVIPFIGARKTLGHHVLVAWDDSRESARAIADALPFLQRAARVSVVRWNQSVDNGNASSRSGFEALARWLLLHGVTAEMHSETTSIPIPEALLSRASDLDADLIVMGAYGHARWSERMLGGATSGLLSSMTVPVLMSH